MGAAHSRALHALRGLAGPARGAPAARLGLRPRPRRARAVRASATAGGSAVSDWREQVADDRVAVFDNAAPNSPPPRADARRDPQPASTCSCEKPLARSAVEARRLWLEAEPRRSRAHVRLQPALPAGGAAGARAGRGPASSASPRTSARASSRRRRCAADQRRTWRFERAAAGQRRGGRPRLAPGRPRALPGGRAGGGLRRHDARSSTTRDGRPVDVDDAFAAVVELEERRHRHARGLARRRPARATSAPSRSTGPRARSAFDIERLNELELITRAQGGRRLDVTGPRDPFMELWWPAPGHPIGWGDSFIHELRHLLAAVAPPAGPCARTAPTSRTATAARCVRRDPASRRAAARGSR